MAFNWFKKKKKDDPSTDAHTGAEAAAAPEELETQTSELTATEAEPAKTAEEEREFSTPEDQSDDTAEIPPETSNAALTDSAPEEAQGEPANLAPHASQGKGFMARLKRGLAKTRQVLTTNLEDLFQGRAHLDDEMLEQIEEMLITSDIGIHTTTALMEAVTRKSSRITSAEDLIKIIREETLALLSAVEPPPIVRHKPHVIMVIGVNGVGKTTTIGKLAARMRQEGQSVLIAAADTFRAAAIEQLAVWAAKSGADLIRHKDNADPAAVVFDSLEAAQARGRDIVMVDTAGRLHTKVNLMEELKKIRRTIERKISGAPHEVLLVLDATTGQNAVAQAKLFHEAIGITGLVLTKLDGTAKGGVVISICRDLNLPLRYIGVGEGIEDLQPFDARHFVDSLF